MTAFGIRLHLRLFLEGVEVPVISLVSQGQENSPAVASIAIPANDYALEFAPRTLVHAFVHDSWRGAAPDQSIWVQGAGVKSTRPVADPEAGPSIPSAEGGGKVMDYTDLLNDNYKLVFGGEIMGVQYMKTPTGRSVVLQCVDWSSYWDIAYQYMVGGFSLGGGGIRAAFTGASTTVFNDFLEGSGDIVMKLMNTPPRSYPSLKGTLLGAMVHIMEAIGGVYFGPRAIKGTNDFFSLAEMRLHLTQQIGANPFSAQDELRLLSANGFGSLFSKALGGLGKLVSIRQVFLALQRYIFHRIVPMTSPRYIPPLTDPNTPEFELVSILADRSTAPLARAATTLRTKTLELRSRLEKSTSPELAKKQSSLRGGLSKEILGLAAVAAEAQTTARKVGVSGGDWAPLGGTIGLQEVARIFEAASRQYVTLHGLTRKGTTGTHEFPSPTGPVGQQALQLLQDVADAMQKVGDAKHRKRVQRSTSQPDPPARLLTQLYLPDVWMVAPPRCNVLFPENYSQFSYARDFQKEVTRLLLRTHEAFYGSDILFDGFYMAPSRVLGARTGRQLGAGRVGKSPDLADAPAWVVKDLMDHELFTGIIPSFERMSDLNLHAIRGGAVEINGAKVGYAQLACNHLFFQYRFRARQLSVSGRFNPYFALGLPAVVIDKYLSAEALRGGDYDAEVATRFARGIQEAAGAGLPAEERSSMTEVRAADVGRLSASLLAGMTSTHYLGTPSLVSHSVSASGGGTTQIQMAYARTTNERTEFMGDNVGMTAKARRTKNVQIPTIVAALEPPKLGNRGFLGGEIKGVVDVTDAYMKKQPPTKGRPAAAARYGSATLLPLFVSEARFTGRQRRGTKVPVGIEKPASSYGPEVVALVGSGGGTIGVDVLVSFRAFRIVEEVGAYAKEEVMLPPEDLVFPPWYGEAYRSNQVGGLYSYFFGVGAITDPTVILGTTTPKKFGEGDAARTLNLQLEQVAATSLGGPVSQEGQLPVPGMDALPSVPGGGDIGPAGKKADVTLGEVGAKSTVAVAIDALVQAYSACRMNNFDTPQFVQNYTWRPIASMVDLFGTANLQINDLGLVTNGREGFHSRAFGDDDDLRTLVSGGEAGLPQRILGLNAGPKELGSDEDTPDAKISARLDTRKEKRLAVYRYLYALAASRGVQLG